MSEYAWMCLNKQDFQYTSGPKYAKVLNIAKFWIWQGSQYASVTQRSEYFRIYLDRVLKLSWVLNMPGFWIWQVLNIQNLYRVLNMSQYGWIYLNRKWICLNMSEFSITDRFWISIIPDIARGHSTSKWALIERWAYSELSQKF